MHLIKSWALLVVGALVFALVFISIVNFSFDWEFLVPPSLIFAAVLIVVGGAVFANGLLALDSQPKPPIDGGEPQEPDNRNQ